MQSRTPRPGRSDSGSGQLLSTGPEAALSWPDLEQGERVLAAGQSKQEGRQETAASPVYGEGQDAGPLTDICGLKRASRPLSRLGAAGAAREPHPAPEEDQGHRPGPGRRSEGAEYPGSASRRSHRPETPRPTRHPEDLTL
ncbi:hypothetical protein E2C01_024668 [Portunus trituberculatus]|uniref:Uncharacterized protein n=1 Tax=Portunus trituberculatus TaxID=210409 RepID=A0A5B7EB78_PORTR|nr:hypothetical protein [Portunus trituberculatus]